MKKRKGFLLLEALTALLLLSALAISVFPLAGRMAGASFLGSLRAEMGETGLFAMDFMTEKIRNSMNPSASPVSGDRFTYYAKNACGDPAPYELMLNQEKIKVELYNGLVQPVTGETSILPYADFYRKGQAYESAQTQHAAPPPARPRFPPHGGRGLSPLRREKQDNPCRLSGRAHLRLCGRKRRQLGPGSAEGGTPGPAGHFRREPAPCDSGG